MKSTFLKLSATFIFILFLTANSDAFQYETPRNNLSDTAETINFTPTFIDFGFSGINLKYKENVPERPDFKSEESGFIPGFCFGISTNQYYPFYASGFVNYIKGNENYDGGIMDLQTNTITPHTGTTGSTFFQLDLDLNYRFNIVDDFEITPFAGYSIRSWTRILGKGTDGEFEEDYKWQSIPIGCKLNYNFDSDLSIGLSAQMNLMINGTIKINYGGVYPISLTLGNVDGYKIEMPFIYKLTDNFKLGLAPYYEHYAFNESNKATFQVQGGTLIINEPSSKTNNVGIKVIGRLYF